MVKESQAETELLERWRWEYARALGFSPDDAWLIARDHDQDLHQIETLIQLGCSLELARRIA